MKFNSKTKTPRREGWYITRTDDGFISWRAWGNGAWWKQLKDGWMEWFDGDGRAMRYEWASKPRVDVLTDFEDLPDIETLDETDT